MQALAFPNGVMAACMACKHGVKRAHLVDARMDGGLLLELYTRDGVGTMISTDFYEGIRPAVSRPHLAMSFLEVNPCSQCKLSWPSVPPPARLSASHFC